MFQNRQKQTQNPKEKAESTFNFDDVVIEQIRTIMEISKDLQDSDNNLHYYYAVDSLYDLLGAWFEDHPQLLKEITETNPLKDVKHSNQLNENHYKDMLSYSKQKFRVILKLIHLEGLDKRGKRQYSLEVGVHYGIV